MKNYEKAGENMKIRIKDVAKFNELLIRHGLSKSAFSREIGISTVAGNNLCNGKTTIKPEVAKKTTEVLKVPFDELFKIVRDPGRKVMSSNE